LIAQSDPRIRVLFKEPSARRVPAIVRGPAVIFEGILLSRLGGVVGWEGVAGDLDIVGLFEPGF
jgi:hypothetical protein